MQLIGSVPKSRAVANSVSHHPKALEIKRKECVVNVKNLIFIFILLVSRLTKQMAAIRRVGTAMEDVIILDFM